MWVRSPWSILVPFAVILAVKYCVMYCKQGIIGAQFSHTQRGHALCCASFTRHYESPKTVWHSKLLDARQNLSNNIKIKDCTPCYEMEGKGIQSFRQIYN